MGFCGRVLDLGKSPRVRKFWKKLGKNNKGGKQWDTAHGAMRAMSTKVHFVLRVYILHTLALCVQTACPIPCPDFRHSTRVRFCIFHHRFSPLNNKIQTIHGPNFISSTSTSKTLLNCISLTLSQILLFPFPFPFLSPSFSYSLRILSPCHPHHDHSIRSYCSFSPSSTSRMQTYASMSQVLPCPL